MSAKEILLACSGRAEEGLFPDQAAVERAAPNLSVTVVESAVSTNTLVKQLADCGAPEGTTVIARRQTGGRGRLGRSFFSPEGGLYFSLLLRPKMAPEETLYLTVAAAVAAAEATEAASGNAVQIKWVNDLYQNEKKICGILAEGFFRGGSGPLDAVILGVGLNLVPPKDGFPEWIGGHAGAVFDRMPPTRVVVDWIGMFNRRFFDFYRNLAARNYLPGYRERSFLQGRTVTYEKDGKTHTGRVCGIDDRARLLICENGETVALGAGDVSVRW